VVAVAVDPSAGTLTLEGHAPTVTATDHVVIAIGAGSLTLQGYTTGDPVIPSTPITGTYSRSTAMTGSYTRSTALLGTVES
jgi:L-2-hydroxyglutarate oxidase LhgO